MKIAVGGQMDKNLIADLIKETSPSTEVMIMSDIEAAMAVNAGTADYYVGACATGAGAALAMAIGLIGADRSVSLSIPGKISSDEEIRNEVVSGKLAFGFVNNDADRIIPVLVKALEEKGE